MRRLEYILSVKILLEISLLFYGLYLQMLRPLTIGIQLIIIAGAMLLLDTGLWIEAKKTLKRWDNN